MTFEDFQREPFTPFDVLDKLIRAGLGDMPQGEITLRQFDAAMRGEYAKDLREPKKSTPIARKIHNLPPPLAQPIHRYSECGLGMGCVCKEAQ